MIEKKTGKGMKAKLLIAFLTVALVFTMMPLTMGNAYADDDSTVAENQVESDVVGADQTSEDADVVGADQTSEDADVVETEESTDIPMITAKGVTSLVLKGNLLKEEKTVTADDLNSIIEKNPVTFTGVNQKYGNVGTATITKGVYIEKLISYLKDEGLLKEGAQIETFYITSEKKGEVTRDKFNYEWLMNKPDTDEFNNGKAMLAFEYEEADKQGQMETKTDVRVFLGCFSKDMPRSPQNVNVEEGALADHIANKPLWKEGILALEISGTVKEPAPAVKDGQQATVSGNSYIVTSASAGTAALVKAKDAKRVTVPATITVNGKTLNVTQINANAFQGKKIRIVTIGKNVKTIKAYAFKKSKARTLLVKTKNLTKKSIKGSLKGSKVKLVRAKIGSKKTNRKYVKKFRKIFTKKNVGKRVKIRR